VREDPTPVLAALTDVGPDIDDVTATLLREGIDAFVTPMQKLLAGTEAKRDGV
jgi:transaldolase